MEKPAEKIYGVTFVPVPKINDLDMVFGKGVKFFDRHNLPNVPRKFTQAASSLFFNGGEIPEFEPDIDRQDAARMLRAMLGSFDPPHESKEATAGYALWVWSTPKEERAQ